MGNGADDLYLSRPFVKGNQGRLFLHLFFEIPVHILKCLIGLSEMFLELGLFLFKVPCVGQCPCKLKNLFMVKQFSQVKDIVPAGHRYDIFRGVITVGRHNDNLDMGGNFPDSAGGFSIYP